MEKWKRKNLPDIKTISSDIMIDSPLDPIEKLKEIIQNMQFSHKEHGEAMKEQFVVIIPHF
jgi:hypothetical protein